MSRKPRVLVALVAMLAMIAASCGSSGSREDSDDGSPSGEITVSAAASLTEAFTEIGAQFEAANPGTRVVFNFDSSSSLAQQVLDGAPADVFASADVDTATRLDDAGLLPDATPFARNRLVIVAKPGNPEGIESLADLTEVGVVSLCGDDAPCGRFAAAALSAAGVTIDEGSVTRGQNAKATLAAVSEGDAVAGVVYATDAAAAGDSVSTIEIPGASDVVATYPIGVLSSASNPDLADAFVAFVLSTDAARSLDDLGFLAPT